MAALGQLVTETLGMKGLQQSLAAANAASGKRTK
jgi:hypothetical protein